MSASLVGSEMCIRDRAHPEALSLAGHWVEARGHWALDDVQNEEIERVARAALGGDFETSSPSGRWATSAAATP
eukprot:7448534-Alexandrium_andersonii.AAC.2